MSRNVKPDGPEHVDNCAYGFGFRVSGLLWQHDPYVCINKYIYICIHNCLEEPSSTLVIPIYIYIYTYVYI